LEWLEEEIGSFSIANKKRNIKKKKQKGEGDFTRVRT